MRLIMGVNSGKPEGYNTILESSAPALPGQTQ